MISIRKAQPEDVDRILVMRNQDHVRRSSFNSELIKSDVHRKWFASVLSNRDVFLYLLVENDNILGVFRYDMLSKEKAEISFYLDQSATGRGLGAEGIRLSERKFLEECETCKIILGRVLSSNEASIKIFDKCEYERHSVLFEKRCR